MNEEPQGIATPEAMLIAKEKKERARKRLKNWFNKLRKRKKRNAAKADS